VRQCYDNDPTATGAVLERLGRITDEVVVDLRTSDIAGMGRRMTEAHTLLAQLGVSNDRLDQLVAAAVGAGALGAKLTGGGRGGCVIALAATEHDAEMIEKALSTAGAAGTWIHAPYADEVAS